MGVLEVSVMLNILAFCGGSNKSSSRMKEHLDNTLTPQISDQCMLMSEVSYGIYPTSLYCAFWR